MPAGDRDVTLDAGLDRAQLRRTGMTRASATLLGHPQEIAYLKGIPANVGSHILYGDRKSVV